MNIALVNPYPIHAGAVGGVSRVYQLARFLAPRHRVWVLAHEADRPLPAGAGSELRALGITQCLYPRVPATRARKVTWLVGDDPYFVGRNRNPALERALVELDRRERLDLVHVEFAYLAPLLDALGPRVCRVLAEQETMSLALERLRAVPFGQKTWYERVAPSFGRKVAAFERRVLPAFDRVYGITPGEAARLQAIAARPVTVLPHVVSTSCFPPPQAEPVEPRLLFVGNFTHHPNVHAADWFVEMVWPAIRAAVPSAVFEIVGPGLPRTLAVESAGIEAPGRIDDVAAAYRRCQVFVNPIQSGGGMRGKVLEAFSSARAVVSTSMGLEGIGARDGEHCTVADPPAAFARAVVRYLEDERVRIRHGRAACDLVHELYDSRLVFERLERDFAAVVRPRRAVEGAP